MQPFFDLLKDNVWWEIILLVVVLLVIIGFYYYLEVKGEKVNREGQIMFTAIVTAVYVFQSSLSSMFEWPTPFRILLSAIAILLTLIAPYIIKGNVAAFPHIVAYDRTKNAPQIVDCDPSKITSEQ